MPKRNRCPFTRSSAVRAAWRIDFLVFGAAVALGCSSDSYRVPPCRTNRGTVKIDSNVETCPTITSFEVLPSVVGVGSGAMLYATATVSLGGVPQFMWIATGGTLSNPTSANTVFMCTAPGLFVLTLTVTNDGCSAVVDGPSVTCEPGDSADGADGAPSVDGTPSTDGIASTDDAASADGQASAAGDGP